MKQVFLVIFIIVLSASHNAVAQWKDVFLPDPIAFGVHNNIFFASEPGYVYWLEPSRHEADSGMHLENVSITAFGSIGSYSLAAVNTGTGAGGVYRSINNGSNWIVTHALQTDCFLMFDSALFSGGTGDSASIIGATGGVSVSLDSGMEWSSFSSSPKNVKALAIIGTTVFAGAKTGVFRSTDNGKSWQTTSYTSSVTSLCVLGNIIVIGTGAGIYRSTDGGNNWVNIVPGGGVSVNSIVTDGRYLFAGVFGFGAFLSKDSGQHWDTINYGLTNYLAANYYGVTALGVFDTLLFAAASGNDNRTFVRSIPEIIRSKQASGVVHTLPVNDSIEIFPNPSSGLISIEAGNTSILRVSVLNVLGENMLDIRNNYSSELNVDISKLASGTYFLEIETPNGTVLRKVVRE